MKRLWTLAAAAAFFAVAYFGLTWIAEQPWNQPSLTNDFRWYPGPATPTKAPITPSPPTITPWVRPTPLPTPSVPTYNIVLLGGDQTAARDARGERTDGYQHTDIFVIVHVEMSDPPKATAILVPRNLWVPDSLMRRYGAPPRSFGDMWSMEVYGRKGTNGIHEYVYRVFGLPVDAVFYVRMDRFPELIDKYLGGLSIEVANGLTVHMTGAEVLAYLRDNDNNWGCLEYDCDGRVFRVLDAMKTKAASLSFFNFNMTDLILMTWGQVTSDVGIQQVYGMARDASVFVSHGGTIHYVRLWTPEIQRADTPLDVRGMVPTRPLYEWMNELLTGGN